MNSSMKTIGTDNFAAVRAYIDWAIASGRLTFSPWPLESFQAIPGKPAPEAIRQMEEWTARHLLRGTREKMFSEISEVAADGGGGGREIILSAETVALLKRWRLAESADDGGSLEAMLRRLLERAERMLPEEAYRLLEAYRRRNELASLAAAVRELVDRAETGPPVVREAVRETDPARESTELEEVVDDIPPAPPSPLPRLREEMAQLLLELKGDA